MFYLSSRAVLRFSEGKGGVWNKFESVIVRIGDGNGEVGDGDSLQTHIP